jgi:hypothetical protein
MTEAPTLQSKLVATIVMTIAIAAAATRKRAVCLRILARELAIQAAMPNGAEKRALHQLQLQLLPHLPLQPHLHPLRPLLQWIMFATTEAPTLQPKVVVTTVTTIAIVAAATRNRAA